MCFRYQSEVQFSQLGTTMTSTWIKLNVGGQLFETSLETLVRKCPQSKLARMFESSTTEDQLMMTGEEEINTTNNNVHNLDMDPQAFSAVLNWLR